MRNVPNAWNLEENAHYSINRTVRNNANGVTSKVNEDDLNTEKEYRIVWDAKKKDEPRRTLYAFLWLLPGYFAYFSSIVSEM